MAQQLRIHGGQQQEVLGQQMAQQLKILGGQQLKARGQQKQPLKILGGQQQEVLGQQMPQPLKIHGGQQLMVLKQQHTNHQRFVQLVGLTLLTDVSYLITVPAFLDVHGSRPFRSANRRVGIWLKSTSGRNGISCRQSCTCSPPSLTLKTTTGGPEDITTRPTITTLGSTPAKPFPFLIGRDTNPVT